MIPAAVRHRYVLLSDERSPLCSLCGQALHMSKGEIALLQYYAACSDGFRPAVATVCKETGLSRRQAFYARNMLVKHGIIDYSEKSIIIDWERIRLFSTLDPQMTGKHCTIEPVEGKKLHYNVLCSRTLIQRIETCPLEQALMIFSSLTDRQYEGVRKYLQKKYAVLQKEAA